MKLSLKERLVLLSVLPKKGNFKNLVEIRALGEVLRITEAERVEIDMHNDEATGTIQWNTEKAKPKDVTITAKGLEIIQKGLTDLDKRGEATEDHLDVWKRFEGMKAEVVEMPKG